MENSKEKNQKIYVGIDPGVSTGFAVLDNFGQLTFIKTMKIHEAIFYLESPNIINPFVIYEDARLATYRRGDIANQSRIQGAGSIKRDCKIWNDYLSERGFNYKAVRPQKQLNNLAKNKKIFNQQFSYSKNSSHHARIAALLARQAFQANSFNFNL